MAEFYSFLCAKLLQSCLALCDPMDCSQPGSCDHGVSPARILDGLPCLPPGDLPNPGIEPRSPSLQSVCLPESHKGSPKERIWTCIKYLQGFGSVGGMGNSMHYQLIMSNQCTLHYQMYQFCERCSIIIRHDYYIYSTSLSLMDTNRGTSQQICKDNSHNLIIHPFL